MATRLLLTRRSLLLATAGGAVLAACGGDGGGDSAGPTTTEADPDLLRIAPVFFPEQPVGRPVRLPLALADVDGIVLQDVPGELSVRIRSAGGEVGPPVTVERHDRSVPRPYFPLVTTLASEGPWTIEVEAGGRAVEPVTVTGRAARDLPAVPSAGEGLPSLVTPTLEDAGGVDPICTRDPICPLHATSLDAALGGGRPVALLVSTPAFCQTAVCGPVLELLLERQGAIGDRGALIHAEVYTDRTAETTTPAVQALGLPWEPSLFLADAEGRVVERLDYTFDAVELDDAIDRWLA